MDTVINPDRSSEAADVVAFLRRSALIDPGRVAVASGDIECTYAQLLALVQSWAKRLPKSVGGMPEPIAVVAEHDSVVPELYLGVMAAGHAVIPLSTRLPDEVIARIVALAGVRLGILAPSAKHRKRGLAESAASTRWISNEEDPRSQSLPETRVPLPDGTAMVSFTSGTTGEPKGVVLSHLNLVTHGLTGAITYRAITENVHVNPMPLAHFAGASRVILAIVNSGTHVILPEFAPRDVLQAVVDWHGTHLMVVPTMAADLLAVDPENYDLGALTLIYGAAPMPMPLAGSLVERLQCDLVNGYGLTESSALATALGPEAHRRAVADGDHELLGSVGQAVPGIELQIVDETLREVPPGVSGQIVLRGPKVSRGYLNRPTETAERFLPDGWLLTRDEGRLSSSGNLTILGRMDDMIITGGVNVQPLEVENEAVLIEGVVECAVFAVPSDRWGQEVRLAVVSALGSEVDPEHVRSFLRQRLDPYKVPKSVHIVNELPRSTLGKIQRGNLTSVFSKDNVEAEGANG